MSDLYMVHSNNSSDKRIGDNRGTKAGEYRTSLFFFSYTLTHSLFIDNGAFCY